MTPNYNAVCRQLDFAINLLRSGRCMEISDTYRSFDESYIQKTLSLIYSCWETGSTAAGLKSNASTVELLKVCLHADPLIDRGSNQCIMQIQKGVISGKSSIYCISEISSSICNFLDEENADGKLVAIIHTVLYPYQSLTSFGSSSTEYMNTQSCNSCLELIPPAIHAIRSVQQKSLRASVQTPDNVVDNILDINCHPDSALALCNLLSTIFSKLRKKQIKKFKEKLWFIARDITNYVEDIVGFMKLLLQILDCSADADWCHLLRMFYAKTPSSYLPMVNGVLEQLFLQCGIGQTNVVDIIEDSCIGALHDQKNSGLTFPQDCNTLAEAIALYPSTISVSDIHLLLLISRGCRGDRISGTLSLPVMMQQLNLQVDCHTRMTLRLSRAIVVAAAGFAVVNGQSNTCQTSQGAGDRWLSSVEEGVALLLQVCGSSSSSNRPHSSNGGNPSNNNPSSSNSRSSNPNSSNSSNPCSSNHNRSIPSNSNPCSSSSSSGSSSSSSNNDVSETWTQSFLTIELLTAVFNISCCPQVLQSFLPVLNAAAVSISNASNHSQGLADDEIIWDGDVTADRLLCMLVLSVFSLMPSCRQGLINTCLRGLAMCASFQKSDFADASMIDNKWISSSRSLRQKKMALSTNSNISSLVSTQQQAASLGNSLAQIRKFGLNSGLMQSGVEIDGDMIHRDPSELTVISFQNIFLHFLKIVCHKFPHQVVATESILHNFIPSLTLQPLQAASNIYRCIEELAVYDRNLYDSLISVHRKGLLYSNLHFKMTSIKNLCALASAMIHSCGQDNRSPLKFEVLNALLFVFSMPLSCRRILYANTISILQSFQFFDHNNNSASVVDEDFLSLDSNDQLQGLHIFHSYCLKAIAKYFVEIDDLSTTRGSTRTPPPGATARLDRTLRSNLCTSTENICFDICKSYLLSSDKRRMYLLEDFHQLLLLCWTMETTTHASQCLERMYSIAKYISSKSHAGSAPAFAADSVCYYIMILLKFIENGMSSEYDNTMAPDSANQTIENWLLFVCCSRDCVDGIISCLQWGISICQRDWLPSSEENSVSYISAFSSAIGVLASLNKFLLDILTSNPSNSMQKRSVVKKMDISGRIIEPMPVNSKSSAAFSSILPFKIVSNLDFRRLINELYTGCSIVVDMKPTSDMNSRLSGGMDAPNEAKSTIRKESRQLEAGNKHQLASLPLASALDVLDDFLDNENDLINGLLSLKISKISYIAALVHAATSGLIDKLEICCTGGISNYVLPANIDILKHDMGYLPAILNSLWKLFERIGKLRPIHELTVKQVKQARQNWQHSRDAVKRAAVADAGHVRHLFADFSEPVRPVGDSSDDSEGDQRVDSSLRMNMDCHGAANQLPTLLLTFLQDLPRQLSCRLDYPDLSVAEINRKYTDCQKRSLPRLVTQQLSTILFDVRGELLEALQSSLLALSIGESAHWFTEATLSNIHHVRLLICQVISCEMLDAIKVGVTMRVLLGYLGVLTAAVATKQFLNNKAIANDTLPIANICNDISNALLICLHYCNDNSGAVAIAIVDLIFFFRQVDSQCNVRRDLISSVHISLLVSQNDYSGQGEYEMFVVDGASDIEKASDISDSEDSIQSKRVPRAANKDKIDFASQEFIINSKITRHILSDVLQKMQTLLMQQTTTSDKLFREYIVSMESNSDGFCFQNHLLHDVSLVSETLFYYFFDELLASQVKFEAITLGKKQFNSLFEVITDKDRSQVLQALLKYLDGCIKNCIQLLKIINIFSKISRIDNISNEDRKQLKEISCDDHADDDVDDNDDDYHDDNDDDSRPRIHSSNVKPSDHIESHSETEEGVDIAEDSGLAPFLHSICRLHAAYQFPNAGNIIIRIKELLEACLCAKIDLDVNNHNRSSEAALGTNNVNLHSEDIEDGAKMSLNMKQYLSVFAKLDEFEWKLLAVIEELDSLQHSDKCKSHPTEAANDSLPQPKPHRSGIVGGARKTTSKTISKTISKTVRQGLELSSSSSGITTTSHPSSTASSSNATTNSTLVPRSILSFPAPLRNILECVSCQGRNILRELRRHREAASLAAGTDTIADANGNSVDPFSSKAVSSSVRYAEILSKSQKRRQLGDRYMIRSSNPVIDAWQRETVVGETSGEKNFDSYADLEGFIAFDEEITEHVHTFLQPRKKKRGLL